MTPTRPARTDTELTTAELPDLRPRSGGGVAAEARRGELHFPTATGA